VSIVRLSDLVDFLVALFDLALCSLCFAADDFDFILMVDGKIALLMLKLLVSGVVLPSYPDGIYYNNYFFIKY